MKTKRSRRRPLRSSSSRMHARRARLVELITNPPPGSKIAAARDYGVDLTLLVENLMRTPTELLKNNYAVAAFHQELRKAVECARSR